MTKRRLISFFLIFRMIDILIIVFAQNIVPYLGFFPYKEIQGQYQLPSFFSALSNFDGVHYLLIAREGYNQYQQAFFPMYPILIKYVSVLFWGNHLLTGILLSNGFFLGAILMLNGYLKTIKYETLNTKHITWTILLLIIFPTSFFFGAVYTESLFLFLFISSLYFLKKERYFYAALFAYLASLTRFIGVFLFIPIFVSHLLLFKSKKAPPISHLLSFISPFLGLITYSLYLWKTTGDPLFFLNSQWAFGAHRSSNIILLPQVLFRYFKIFFTAAWNFQYWISVFEFFTFCFFFVILIYDLFSNLKFIDHWKLKIENYDRFALNIFSFANLLLPTLTGTFSSIPRYSLLSLSFFLALGRIGNENIKKAVAFIFMVIHIITLGFFTQGYFVS